MTKGMGNFVTLVAMGKGVTESNSGETKISGITSDDVSTYSNNIFETALYKTPLNPLLTRGTVGEGFDNFTAASATASINSYEIHKADNTTLPVTKYGINLSNRTTTTSASGSGVQTYTAVNRIYPNANTGTSSISEHLSNLSTTKGNQLKMFDYVTNQGQPLVNARTRTDGVISETASQFDVNGTTDLSVDDVIIIDDEQMLINEISSNTLTVTRGYNNSIVTTHIDDSRVLEIQIIDHLWVLVYSDDANLHHFAKVTELLEDDIYGDTIEFSPSLNSDIPKDTKFAIFSSYDANLPKIDSDNQTLVACAYGLQATATATDIRHYINTHVSRPFFFFLNGKDRLEPATRYILRSSSWNGTAHTYTYSTFLTDQEHGAHIVDYGPFTMEATLVDMMYKADNPAAMNYLEISSNNLELVNGTPDKITVSTDASFDNSITDLDGTEGTNWGITGILRDSRIVVAGAQGDIYAIDSATDSTVDTLTMDAADFTAGSTSDDLDVRFLASSVDLDHNKIYSAVNPNNKDGSVGNDFKNSFRMAQRPQTDSTLFGFDAGHTRYLHYCDSPLTNTLIPNAMEMIEYESVTSTGGYVDIVFADTQKILAKKIKEGDPLYIHHIVSSEEVTRERTSELSDVEFNFGTNGLDIIAKNLGAEKDLRFLLSSSIPKSSTSTGSRYDPLHDTITIDISGIPYHFNVDLVGNKATGTNGGSTQALTIRSWRKGTDTEYVLTSGTNLATVPSFDTKAYRNKYSFLTDNLITNIPIDTKITNYILDGNGATADTNWNRNVTDFDTILTTRNPVNDYTGSGANTKPTVNIGEVKLEKSSQSRLNDIHLVLKGGQLTGHRIKVAYGDKHNSFLKLQTHLKDERFLENFNRTDVAPYLDKLSNVSLYSYFINSAVDPSNGAFRYDLARSNTSLYPYVRGILSYLDYFNGAIDIERRVFSGVVESVEQVIEDGMFKLKIKGRNNISDLLGPVINKDFKFTDDIIYSTVGPIERMAQLSQINHDTAAGIYEVGTTAIKISGISYNSATQEGSPVNATAGDMLYTATGTFLGRIYSITGSGDPYTVTFEEGIPTRLKDDESIFISGNASAYLLNQTPQSFTDISGSQGDDFKAKGNMISFSKAMSSNPYNTTRVSSLVGASNKGVIFTGGNSLTLTNGAPVGEGNTLVGTSASTNPLAKGYSIHGIGSIDYDLPFYCHFADEITGTNTIDYTNLNTVNSLTEYDIISVNSNKTETTIEVAPICPAVLARIDNNPLDGRDKILVTMDGNFPTSYSSGYNGPIEFSTWIRELKMGDYIFSSSGELYGQIIDISVGSTGVDTSEAVLEGNLFTITLDRPLFEAVTSSTSICKYYTSSTHDGHYNGTGMYFSTTTGLANLSGTNYMASRLTASTTASKDFLRTLKPNMRIRIEGGDDANMNGVFSITHVFVDDESIFGEDTPSVHINSRKIESGKNAAASVNAFHVHSHTSSSFTVRITVLTDYFTQGLYFLNTQGLTQGGILTLTNNYLSSPNAYDNTCKPIKYSGGLHHFITDNSITVDGTEGSLTRYNLNASEPVIFSDVIDRYGNTKWRYFGLQRGRYLSYINRRRKDGQIKETYSTEKGRVIGYSSAYRIADAKFGIKDVYTYPYAYHNNDFAWNVNMYDPNISSPYLISLYDANSDISTHPYFLEYLSPESRDFRPILGSNFADFDKHGTYVTSPDDIDHRTLQYPRFMPRIHDNFGGGDWQEDMEAPVNNIDDSIIYKKFTANNGITSVSSDTNFRFKLNVDNTTDLNWDIEYEANSDTRPFPAAISNRWIKLSNYNDRVINRAFKLGASGSGDANIRTLIPPYTHWDSSGTSTVQAVGKLTGDVSASGFEELTILYPPHIGPKFDGITRAKDHWELPDPKTMRWHIFSPADMYPDSMSRKHHIGYSGISRSFTDYNIMLKGQGTFTKSNTSHEFYEGSLEEEIETDDQYDTLPITTASILPSEIKRFGLMRLIDCTYDWHFNLIDPERLPRDMTKLTTPNFEYTRFQPLRRLDAKITGYDTSGDVLTTSVSDITSHLQQGDQIFTDEGRYIGKVHTLNDVTDASTITMLGDYLKHNIFKSDGDKAQYFGYVHVCGDGTTGIHDRETSDSFYQFTTKGRGGTNTFTEVGESLKLNMLQSMINAAKHGGTNNQEQVPYGTITGTIETGATYSLGSVISVADAANYSTGMGIAGKNIYGGAVVTARDTSANTITISPTPSGSQDGGITRLPRGSGIPSIYNLTTPSLDIRDSGITENKFLNHFSRNFSTLQDKINTTSSSVTNSFINNGTFVLPPAFRTFYSERLDFGAVTTLKHDTHRTINAMASKEDLVIDDAAVGTVVNNRDTEYAHASNVLEWMQNGGNPYYGCDIVFLGSYSVENSITKPSIGGKIGTAWGGIYPQNFAHSKSKNDAVTNPLADSMSGRHTIKYGSGNAPDADFANGRSGEYSFVTIEPNLRTSGYATFNSDDDSDSEPFFDSESSNYVAAGVYSAFVPQLCLDSITNELGSLLHGLKSNVISNADVDSEIKQGVVTFNSINGSNSKEGVLKIITRPPISGLVNADDWSFEVSGVVLTHNDATVTCNAAAIRVGMELYVQGGVGATVSSMPSNAVVTSINAGTEGVNVTSFEMNGIFDHSSGTSFTGQTLSFSEAPFKWNHFLNFTDLTGMYLVGNFGFSAGDNPTSGNQYAVSVGGANHAVDLLGAVPFNSEATVAPQSLELLINHSIFKQTDGVFTNGVKGRSIARGIHKAEGSCENMMVVPDHVIYIKEHRRNITGKEVAHELLIDNVPLDKEGNPRFYNNYRVMRPAEHCLWATSPNEIDMYKLSAQTTKMPKSNAMYGHTPSQSRVSNQHNFTGSNIGSTTLDTSTKFGENEAVMSMYVAVDMDARHSQQKQLTQTATIAIGENVVVFNSSVANDIQVGDKLKLGNQKCYVKSISANGLNVTIAGRFASDSALSGATVHLLNNTFTVLRDYAHLFNPSGNRNTFKSGEAYNMLLTDGLNKQKISMGVEADYYHDRALCRLSIGKIENDLLGLVSFGEIFSIKSNVPTNLPNVTSAKIGSTVAIGEEVEDIINNLLSGEDIQYDISDNREYPYYLTPNFQGVDLFNATNFAAKYKEKEIRVDEKGVSLIKQSNDLDFRDIVLSYDNKDLRIISVTRNKSTFDLYNEIIVYGNGKKAIKRNRKSIDKFGKKTLEEVNMELISQDDVDIRAKKLLKAHSDGDDRFTIKMSSKGVEFIKAGDIITLDFPSEGVPADTYKVYEIRRELKGLLELEAGTYRKDLANRFAELSMTNKSNSASIRGSQFTSTTSPLDFFDSVKLKELRLMIKRVGLVDSNAFTLGFQTLTERKLDFETTMGPQETVTEIIIDEDFI